MPQQSPATKRTWLGWAVVMLIAAGLLAGAAAGGWWWRRAVPTSRPVPPMPVDIQDAEVRGAVEHARQKVLDKPGDASAWGNLGMTLEAHLYEAEADRCFAEAARLDPADARWPYFRGLYALKYEPDRAMPLLRQAASCRGLAEDESAVRLRLAEALLERQEIGEAETLFRREWVRQPEDPRAAYGLGLVALAKGDDRSAEKFLAIAQSSPTARRAATAQLAALARSRGDDKTAARYEKEVAPRPGDTLAWPDPLVEQILGFQTGAGNWSQDVAQLERERRFAEAAQVYLKQIEKQPTTQAYIGAGLNLARVRDYDRALPLLREAVRLDTDSIQAHYTLAMALFSRAESDWQQSPNSAQAKAWFREAIEHAQRTVALKPDHARAYLFWGLALKYLGESAAAIAPLRKGVTCRPVDFDLQFALGGVLLETEQYQEAGVFLENARKLSPEDQRVAEALDRLRKKQGKD
jgi:tetratricopeptide (TPR) repeat protein